MLCFALRFETSCCGAFRLPDKGNQEVLPGLIHGDNKAEKRFISFEDKILDDEEYIYPFEYNAFKTLDNRPVRV